MIHTTTESIRNGVGYLKKHPQIFGTFLLILCVPVAFIFSAQQFLNVGLENQERLEKDRIGIIHDLFASLLSATQFDIDSIQTEIEYIGGLNPDIVTFIVAEDTGDSVRIVATNHVGLIDTLDNDVTLYRLSFLYPNESIITPHIENGVRHWRAYRLVQDDTSTYYIYTKTSLAHIDTAFSSRIEKAYLMLAIILIILLILLLRHVRMTDYAYLYSETKKLNSMKDLYTNMIAHELRAPLTAMRGYASLIRENSDSNDSIKNQAENIERASQRLITIVNDLLDVARIQSGKLEISKESKNVQTMVQSVLSDMRALAEEKKITLTQEGVRNKLLINTDEKRLYQALTNLVSNAIKYTSSGIISLELIDLKSRIEIRVKDTGMGISSEHQKNIFTPFFRVTSSEVEKITGTGLGMFITKQLIELLGGSIGIESIKGVGTHVVVTLPK